MTTLYSVSNAKITQKFVLSSTNIEFRYLGLEGILTNFNFNSVESTSTSLTSTFSFVENASVLTANVSPVNTEIENSISSNSVVVDLTNLIFFNSIIGLRPDVFQIEVNVKPVTAGASSDDITPNGTIEMFYSDAYKYDIVLSF